MIKLAGIFLSKVALVQVAKETYNINTYSFGKGDKIYQNDTGYFFKYGQTLVDLLEENFFELKKSGILKTKHNEKSIRGISFVEFSELQFRKTDEHSS